ncbi:MSCRAMM family adhesin SdrC [Rubripirellula amarantea]|nr:MSCRAMM family adhesin SdrC [Rubripirellula amarantea]
MSFPWLIAPRTMLEKVFRRSLVCVAAFIFLIACPWAIAGADEVSPLDVGGADAAPTYNLGIAAYQARDWKTATDCFRRAATSNDNQLAADARYNLGNSLVAEYLDNQQQSSMASQSPDGEVEIPAASVETLQSAIDAFRSSLRLRPGDDDARFNLESTMLLLQQEQEKQPSQSDQSQSKPSEDSDSDSPENADDSENVDDSESENADDSENAEKSDDTGQPQDDAAGQENQSSDSDQGNQTPQQDPNNGQSPGSNPEDSGNESSKDDDSQTNNPGDEDTESGESGSDNKEQAAEQSSAQNQNQSDPRDNSSLNPNESSDDGGQQSQDLGEGSESQTPPPSGDLSADNASVSEQPIPASEGEEREITPQEAQKLLQAIRDRDMLRRLRLDAAKRSRRIAVPRDW